MMPPILKIQGKVRSKVQACFLDVAAIITGETLVT